MEIIGHIGDILIFTPMVNGLLLIYSVIPNYGLSIILFTLAIALLTMPLRIKSQHAMKEQQLKTAALKPKLDELKKKYKDNPQQMQAAQMKLYQENGMANPINSGCLLQLLPTVFLIGLYNVVTSVMGDKPEQLLQLSQRLYPFLPQLGRLAPVDPNFFGLNLAVSPQAQGIVITVVIVALVVGSQFVQQRMMTLPTASLDPQQAQMNSSMQLMMPLFFGWIVLGAPTGLSLYWITFGLIGIVQQYFTSGWGNLFGTPAAQKQMAKPKKSDSTIQINADGNGHDNGRELQRTAPVNTSSGSKKGKKNRAKKS